MDYRIEIVEKAIEYKVLQSEVLALGLPGVYGVSLVVVGEAGSRVVQCEAVNICGDGELLEADLDQCRAVIAGHSPTLDAPKQAAIAELNLQAGEAEERLDSLVTGKPVRSLFLNTEIVEYVQQGRPAEPAANMFVISNALATRRGITLREMLEILFSKWRDIQADIGAIVTELDRVTEAIEAAQSEAEIQVVLDSLSWP